MAKKKGSISNSYSIFIFKEPGKAKKGNFGKKGKGKKGKGKKSWYVNKFLHYKVN